MLYLLGDFHEWVFEIPLKRDPKIEHWFGNGSSFWQGFGRFFGLQNCIKNDIKSTPKKSPNRNPNFSKSILFQGSRRAKINEIMFLSN